MLHQATIETAAAGRTAAEFPASETIAGTADAGIVILCDHASNAIPAEYGQLGMAPFQLGRHIAYDIGAAGVTRGLAAALGVPAVLSTFSRLLIDPNRGRDDPTMVMRLSDRAIVPGNALIGEDEIARRVDRYYDPYHAAITTQIDACIAAGKAPVLFSIHSFTPVWHDVPRRWQVGVLWDRDPRFAVPLIEALETEGDLEVGDNEPYRGSLKGDCLHRHGTGRGLAHALIEIRQDLIADDDGVASWVERLARLVPPLMARHGLHDIVHYGSHSD
jgi:predicted N-formylglutamate amidohydrolase